MQKLSSFGRGKKFRPKKSLTSLLYAALQFLSGPVHSPVCFSVIQEGVGGGEGGGGGGGGQSGSREKRGQKKERGC